MSSSDLRRGERVRTMSIEGAQSIASQSAIRDYLANVVARNGTSPPLSSSVSSSSSSSLSSSSSTPPPNGPPSKQVSPVSSPVSSPSPSPWAAVVASMSPGDLELLRTTVLGIESKVPAGQQPGATSPSAGAVGSLASRLRMASVSTPHVLSPAAVGDDDDDNGEDVEDDDVGGLRVRRAHPSHRLPGFGSSRPVMVDLKVGQDLRMGSLLVPSAKRLAPSAITSTLSNYGSFDTMSSTSGLTNRRNIIEYSLLCQLMDCVIQDRPDVAAEHIIRRLYAIIAAEEDGDWVAADVLSLQRPSSLIDDEQKKGITKDVIKRREALAKGKKDLKAKAKPGAAAAKKAAASGSS